MMEMKGLNTYITTLCAKEMTDMPLRPQCHNNLPLNRRLTALTSRAEFLMIVQMAIKPLRIVPAIVFCHLSFCFLVVVVFIGMLSTSGDALEAGVAVGRGLGVEG